MSTFKLHTLDTAPSGSLPILDTANKAMGFIPNLYAHLASSPAALQGYKQLGALFEQSGLTPKEQQVVLLTVSAENGCEYCVAAHSFIARNIIKVADDKIGALRNGQPTGDAKLDALVAFAQAVVRERGWVAESQELNNFFAAGYTTQHALDVILGVAMKTLSNYTNHLTDTPLDAAFAGEAWQAPDENACCAAAA